MVSASLLTTLRTRLHEAAEPRRAAGMQAYMKSVMPYHGVTSVPLRRVCRELFGELVWRSPEGWQAEVLAIWRGAMFREERYAAIELSGVKAARLFQNLSALPIYEEMIVTGAWWDYVDAISGQRLWAILECEGAAMKREMLRWSVDANMWKRRSAILCQLRGKEKTDVDFLYACIEPSLDSKEFFLRKAIGWALRQYAWTDPDEVRRYVTGKETRLSGLSRREALKNIGKAA